MESLVEKFDNFELGFDTKKRRQIRADRRKKEEENVSSDTSTDTEETEERKRAKEKYREFKKKLNLKRRFTYEKLIDGFKKGKFKKIAILTGAGISVSAGIPDFRSPKTGLYDNLSQYNLPAPKSMFEWTYFMKTPQPFYHLAKEFLDISKFNPTTTHFFIKLLEDKKLLDMYMTQNIDNLEAKAGIKNAIYAHGANIGASCARCGQAHDEDKMKKAIDT